ncbi:sugar ABC transporter substrate-binding protein [Chloroflexi bacterium TSY]|nr:sugar ABC transporter substrate-binding protein [Chloroflexi bacterium TSY]
MVRKQQVGHRLSRRSFLAIAGAGLSAVAVGACVAPTAAPATTDGGEAVMAEGGEVNLVYWADSNDFFQGVIDQFEEETSNTVNYEVAPAVYIEWQQMMTTRFASGDTNTDTFHCDDFQAAIYGAAGWLSPLDPVMEKHNIDLSDWPQTLLTDVSSWDGVLYRLPWGNDTEIFFYRTDYFEEAGIEPPTDWNELLEAARALTNEEEERFGIALSGLKGGAFGNDIQHWTNQAGGAINDLDNDGAREALSFYKALFAEHGVASPSVPQDDYGAVFQGWLDNKYAMWWCWDGFFGAMRTNEEFWDNQVSAFLPPMGPDNAQTITGCWGWAIPSGSPKQDLAEQWVEFTARPDVMKQQIFRGRVPARVSLWSDPEVQDLAPSSPFLLALAEAGDLVKARPVTPSIQEIYDAAEENIHAYLTDQISLDEAIESAMSKINPILERDLG